MEAIQSSTTRAGTSRALLYERIKPMVRTKCPPPTTFSKANMMLRWSLILGGILIAAGPVIACKSFDETSASMPASLQMLQMAATEMDEGSPIPSMYRSPLLIAVGRTDEAIRDMLKIEDEFFRGVQAAVIVDQIVRFDAKFSLDDPRLQANLSPEMFAFARADGLLRRGELNAAESELTRIPAENSYAPSFLDLYQRIEIGRAHV